MDNAHTRWLLPDPMVPLSNVLFTSEPVKDCPAGHTIVTVFVSGIPRTSGMIAVPRGVGWLPLVAKKPAS